MPAKSPLPASGTAFKDWLFLAEVSTGLWLCRCLCGVVKKVRRCHLLGGKSSGCGCKRNAAFTSRVSKHRRASVKDALYTCWKNAKSRCLNSKSARYKTYGARGITMDPLWVSNFEAFAAAVGERPKGKTLGRIDNDKGYVPGNIEWQTPKQQGLHTTRSNFITFQGVTKNLQQWAESTGIPRDTIFARLHKLQWSLSKSLTTPVRTPC